jgi:hypothetical protein
MRRMERMKGQHALGVGRGADSRITHTRVQMRSSVSKRTGVVTIALVTLASIAEGCANGETIGPDSLWLSPGVWTSVPSEAMRVKGPQSEVCATVPPEYQFSDTAWVLIAPDGNPVTVRARLVTETGTFMDSLSVGFSEGKDKRTCFRAFARPIGEAYSRVDFLTTDTIVLRDIRWWSGKRTMFF